MLRQRSLFLAISVAWAAAGAAPATAYTGGVWWPESEGGNGHYYNVVRVGSGVDWEVANQTAEGYQTTHFASGGTAHLATLTSAAEQDFVYDQLVFDPVHWNGPNGPWIGLRQTSLDDEPAGNWVWVTEETNDFVAWAPGEPSDLNEVEHYAHFWNNFVTPRNTINDTNLGVASPFLVEYEVDGLTSLGSLTTSAVGNVIAFDAVVTAADDLIAAPGSANLHLQDDTGGAVIFGGVQRLTAVAAELERGTRVRVTARLGAFAGDFSLTAEDPFFSITPLGPGAEPEPQLIAAADLADQSPTAEGLERLLVELPEVRFVIEEGDPVFFTGVTSYTVVDRSGAEAKVRVSTNGQDLVRMPIPEGYVDAIGLFSQFDQSGVQPGDLGVEYSVALRDAADLTLTGDANGDGRVNAADYTIVRDSGEDVARWARNYGGSWDPFNVPIPAPEPGTATLMAVAAIIVGRARRRA